MEEKTMGQFSTLAPTDYSFGLKTRLRYLRLSHLVLILPIVLICVLLGTHYYLPSLGVSENGALHDNGYYNRKKLDIPEDLASIKFSDLKFRIEELKKIKASINKELRELEEKRQKLHVDISGYTEHLNTVRFEYEHSHVELQQIKASIDSIKMERDEMVQRNLPELKAPLRILPDATDSHFISRPSHPRSCRMYNCFDFSRCSVTSNFPVYLYDPHDYRITTLDPFIQHSVSNALNISPHITPDPFMACLYIVLVGETKEGNYNATFLEEKLYNLPHWRGDGRNHLLVNVARTLTSTQLFQGVNTGRAMIAQSQFTLDGFRREFDVILPPGLGIPQGDVWDQMPPLSPARRKHMLSFLGEFYLSDSLAKSVYQGQLNIQPQDKSKSTSDDALSVMSDLMKMERKIVDTLKHMQHMYQEGVFNFQFTCDKKEKRVGLNAEWALCGSDRERQLVLDDSTFNLIILPTNFSTCSSYLTQIRLYESLRSGAIPLVLGTHLELPFSEHLNWRTAMMILPKARVTELHFFLQSISDSDILEMRRQGRLLWQTYLGSIKSNVDMLLASVRTRLQIPAFPSKEESTLSVFNASFTRRKESLLDLPPSADEMLGPIESPLPSLKFHRNFTSSMRSFDIPGTDPFHLYPFTPFEPVLPADAKFLGSAIGFRPIGKGAGGAGQEFHLALGGNHPREQFTIVMLTYEREAVLMDALKRLKDLPHLNKVIVVWNSQEPPNPKLEWPEIGVQIVVAKTSKNSLNNRFLPFDAIETEAVLSIDDDAHLRPDEIIFGFRIWRESRDRIVGFPGRFHAWDLNHQSWLYNSNYSCELSMVLTGAAFFHKYYAYLYSYVMPHAIRSKVDEFMNCEDLALNFLVSHITRKPPIKVTSRWTFRCPGCSQALSEDDSHFQERHKCINFFTKVYGYMPLLNTQFRADSILFKTRIPHDKQKCFKYI